MRCSGREYASPRTIAALAFTFMVGPMALGSAATAAASGAPPCDRACLSNHIDHYLAALVAHDPARLSFAPHMRFTENGQAMALGDGLWANARGLGDYKLYFNDVGAGQAGFMGTVRENGHLAILSLRLKIVGGRIAEAESIVARDQPTSITRPEALRDKPIFREPLSIEQRRPRAAMIAKVRDYLRALIAAGPRPDLFDPNCTRIENGSITANNPDGDRMGRLSCGAQLATGASQLLTRVRDPRFPLVDEEHGLVHLVMFFDHSASKLAATARFDDGTTQELHAHNDTPYSFMCSEVFKLEGGRIRQIEVVLLPVPYRMASGWPSQPEAR